jgi:hypothetical protein
MPHIPLQIYVTPFAERGNVEPSQWSCSVATDALRVVNRIWMVAKIQFQVKDCTEDDPLDMPKTTRTRDQVMLDVLSDRRPAGSSVNVFLINKVPDLKAGGLSYLNSDPEAACFVQRYDNAEANGRALAHELGHLLSLDHVKIDSTNQRLAGQLANNLMKEGWSAGTSLLPGQINNAKTSKLAKRFGG